jgi:thiamine biosynthesis lipoprotein ApbE
MVYHGSTGEIVSKNESASVIAATCLDADALAKCVLLMGNASSSLLRNLDAKAFLITTDGFSVIN